MYSINCFPWELIHPFSTTTPDKFDSEAILYCFPGKSTRRLFSWRPFRRLVLPSGLSDGSQWYLTRVKQAFDQCTILYYSSLFVLAPVTGFAFFRRSHPESGLRCAKQQYCFVELSWVARNLHLHCTINIYRLTWNIWIHFRGNRYFSARRT